MENQFETCEQVAESAKKSWEEEGKNIHNEYFKSFELGWFRSAYRGLYYGMNRVLSELDSKIIEINELKSKLAKYENE